MSIRGNEATARFNDSVAMVALRSIKIPEILNTVARKRALL
jgi:hypothetical protein